MMDLSKFIIPNTPNKIIYIPNFITKTEEINILNGVTNTPKPKWQQLTNRRLINYGGIPHPKGMIAEQMPDWLQIYINKINKLGVFGEVVANHCLVNEYLVNQGIMPHLDGPLFYPTIATISCGSHTVLEFFDTNINDDDGSGEANNKLIGKYKLLVEPRSLLILQNEMYEKYLHSISEIDKDEITQEIMNLEQCGGVGWGGVDGGGVVDGDRDDVVSYKLGQIIKRDKRISLTIRNVPKTSKLKLKLGK